MTLSDPLAEFIQSRRLVLDRGTSNSFSLVRGWINHCNEAHKTCAGPNSRLPTEVLDVSAAPKSLHLFVSNGHYAPYAALSYCWGKLLIYPELYGML